MKHWVRQPLEREIAEGRLRVILYQQIDCVTAGEVTLTTETGEKRTIPNDVVFVLVGSDADLTLLKSLGVEITSGKLTEMPVYDEETFETNVRGVYVVGHFTNARHIKAAIDMPRKIVPLIAQSLRVTAGS
jgi:thioredoxin reductase (NADPH)